MEPTFDYMVLLCVHGDDGRPIVHVLRWRPFGLPQTIGAFQGSDSYRENREYAEKNFAEAYRQAGQG